MGASIVLPGRDEPLVIGEPGWAVSYPPPASRRVFAAAHVAAAPAEEPAGDMAGGGAAEPVIDWDSTLAFREQLWTLGFGVAEAMDTSQRGMGLPWEQARELIARSAQRAAERRRAGEFAGLACGAGTDQLADGQAWSLRAVTDAYAAQLAFVESAGAQVILMASRALAASARGPRDYLDVYTELLRQASQPVILHWLGEAFDPALRGYWGSAGFEEAAGTVLELIDRAGDRVDGVKLSVLDAGHEESLRRRLPAGVRLYTGDDFNYASLIRGPGPHSDALLGVFAAIAAPAAAALQALDAGDLAGYDAAMMPTVPLGRAVFESPTYYYKVGVAFLAWLNGLQPHFCMLAGLQRQRPASHLIRVFELAAAARALTRPELAAGRMSELLERVAAAEQR